MPESRMTIHRFIPCFVFGVLLLVSVANAQAEEQRCKDLGANCVCSEPLNTNSYSLVPGTTWAWNPADSITKQCAIEKASGGVIEDSNWRYQAVSTGEAINALPPGHTNTWILRQNEGGGGQFVGTNYGTNTPTARLAFRGYKFYSSNYDFDLSAGGPSVCLNSNKLIQFGNPGPILTHNGSPMLYSWTNNPSWFPGGMDCCWYGPGDPAFFGEGPNRLKGKWWRIEVIVRNATTSGGTRLEIYRKDVSGNGPNSKIIDTFVQTAQPVGNQWNGGLIKPGGRVDEIWFDWFRNGTCNGHAALSHIMAAAWDTDAGQMIGAAVEIEGNGNGSGDTAPPAAPGNLRVN